MKASDDKPGLEGTERLQFAGGSFKLLTQPSLSLALRNSRVGRQEMSAQ